MTDIPPRFPITPHEIDAVVITFYDRIRNHEVLGPVFFESLPPLGPVWQEHEEKIAAFWRNAILFERSFDGNPQRTHQMREGVMPEHFALWLALFDEVLQEKLTPEQAASWSALAHRIGAGLRMGVENARRPKNAVPILR